MAASANCLIQVKDLKKHYNKGTIKALDGVSVDINRGDVMVVSQFTLAASTKKGNRPSYIGAAGHDLAVPMYELFCQRMEQTIGRKVGHGRFGADMQVSLINDGPVTIIVDSKNPV